MNERPSYRFDRFVFNLSRGCLQEGSADIELRPKSFEVLRHLIENSGRLLSKDELVRAVWPDVIVSDDSLAHCIRDIRKALNDEGESFIKTVPRRGYMFVGEVKQDERVPKAVAADVRKTNAAVANAPELQGLEENYRGRLRAHYAEEAGYFVQLSGATNEIANPNLVGSRRSAGRRRRRARAEYHEWLQGGEETKQVKIESLRLAVERYPCIILLGDPGCGKTSALENLAYEFSVEKLWLPVPLYLGDLNPGESLEEFITRGWTNLNAGLCDPQTLNAILHRCLDAGRLILLFDALNEMPRDQYRGHCLALRQFIDRWSSYGNRFIVSCRVLDYGDELFGLQRVEIQPLSDEKIQQFIANELPENWQALWDALIENEDRSAGLLAMARNPYMLTMMIDVFEEDGKLIRNRSELMRRFVGILTGWASAKSSGNQVINVEVANAALSVMAFEMQRRSGFGTPARTDDVKAIIPRELEVTRGWPLQSCDPDQLLDLATGAKIIETPVDRKTVRFYHQLLQEFFAGQQLLRIDPSQLSHLWQWPWLEEDMPLWSRPENNYEPLPPPPTTGWEETTVLAAGLAPATGSQLIHALCRLNPVLAARCVLETHVEIEPSLRQQVIAALLSVLDDPKVALRVRIAAGDVLGRLGDPRAGGMITIPAGKFLMGERHEQHELWLPEYQIGKYPVTNAEYLRFVDTGGYKEESFWTEAGWAEVGKERSEPRFCHNARFNKPNQPVIGLSWYECVAYCRWLTVQTGQIYRLPTEAEWEKAARGDDGRTYPWGDTFDAKRLNAREGNQKVYCSTPIGVYSAGASPFGLFDCAGNVWQWCSTRWKKPFPYDVAEGEWSQIYLEGRNLRALRGGSWNYEADVAQSAHRFRFEPFGWNDRGGFRTVCLMPG